MPTVVREDIDKLNARLTITVERSEYEPKFNSELGKVKKSANLKGFRRGKTPGSIVKKMYGKSILADVINQMLQTELYEYLQKEELAILGQPIPAEDQELIDFNLTSLQNYEFKFDVGLAPEFEVQGLDTDNVFDKHDVQIPDEKIQEELDAVRKRFGNNVSREDGIEEDDLLHLAVKELDGDDVKEDGLVGDFTVLVKTIAKEEVKKEVLEKKKGDHVKLNLLELEERNDEQFVKKYYLKVPEDQEVTIPELFDAEISDVTYVEQAELNEEFFTKAFGEAEISSEEEAKNFMRENMAKYYDRQAEGFLYRDLQKDLIEKNKLDLPDEFLKRWMLVSNEGLTAEVIEQEYPAFAQNLQWTLLKDKVAKQFEIKVEEEELMERLRDQVRGYFGGQLPAGQDEMIESLAQRLKDDEKAVGQIRDEIEMDKLFKAVSEVVGIELKPIELDEFVKELEAAQAEQQQAQIAAVSAEEEE